MTKQLLTYFEVREEADIEKKVDLDSVATALAIIVCRKWN